MAKKNYGVSLLKGIMSFEVVCCHFLVTANAPRWQLPFSMLKSSAVPVFMLLSWQGFYTAAEGGTVIPTLTVCREIGIPWLTVAYAACLLLCLISTGVTTTFGFVAKFENISAFKGIENPTVKNGIIAASIIAISMGISFAGLTNIIKYGYGYCGYLGIAVIIVPMLTVGVYKNRKFLAENPGYKG